VPVAWRAIVLVLLAPAFAATAWARGEPAESEWHSLWALAWLPVIAVLLGLGLWLRLRRADPRAPWDGPEPES
jgi:cytochrome bd-type quinol oxidase subunit 2